MKCGICVEYLEQVNAEIVYQHILENTRVGPYTAQRAP